MPFLDPYGGTVTMSIGDPARGYWVKLREYVSQGGKEAAEKALSQMLIVDGQPQIDPDTARYRQLLVLAHVVEWNLDDEHGVWPITLENVQRIPGPLFDGLWKTVDLLASPVQDAAERRAFPDRVDDGDPERDERPPVA